MHAEALVFSLLRFFQVSKHCIVHLSLVDVGCDSDSVQHFNPSDVTACLTVREAA